MRNLVTITFLFIVVFGMAQSNDKSITKIAVATYVGLSTEGYYFTNDLDESPMLFAKIRPEALKRCNLNDHLYIRKTFRIIYGIDTIDGKDQLTIINLEQLDYDSDDDGEEG